MRLVGLIIASCVAFHQNQNVAQRKSSRLNETLLVMRAYAPYHQFYAVAMCFAIANNQPDRVPDPDACFVKAQAAGMVEDLVKIGGT